MQLIIGSTRSVVDLPLQVYPSGEPLINFPRGERVERMLVKPASMTELMAALWFADALADRGHHLVGLILPFVPGARQDRLNDQGDYLFTAKSVAKEINLRNFSTVTVVDPHSDVIAALIERCRVVRADVCIGGYLAFEKYDAVVSPDAGAEKRAGLVAKALGLPLLHGWKTRDVATGAINGFGLEEAQTKIATAPEARTVPGAYRSERLRVLVVDDICDGGGTFLGLAEVLHCRGIDAHLYVSHGIFSQGTSKLLSHYGKIFCTDSLDTQRLGVETIPVCQKLLQEDHS